MIGSQDHPATDVLPSEPGGDTTEIRRMMGTAKRITRRTFLQGAAAAGAVAALPLTTATGRRIASQLMMGGGVGTSPSPLPGGPFFLDTYPDLYTVPATGNSYDLYRIASALCARIIPTDGLGPGADEAGAVNYIDLFMGAFEAHTLAPDLIGGPAIYLRGPYSGRWPYGDCSTGEPSDTKPSSDSFEESGVIQFLGLTPNQAIAWYLRIYGGLDNGPDQPQVPKWVAHPLPLSETFPLADPALSDASYSPWSSQATPTGLIPGAQDLRSLYQNGLCAFDDWSQQNYGTGTHFYDAKPEEQVALIALAWNPLLGAASENGFPGLPGPLPNPVPPPDASRLFGTLALHTIQGTYCLPEYNGRPADPLQGQVTWASIGYDGDTQPLGSSIYDENLTTNVPAEPDNPVTNDGFGGEDGSGVYQPTGAYREYRPVSHPDPDIAETEVTVEPFSDVIIALRAAGAKVTIVAD